MSQSNQSNDEVRRKLLKPKPTSEQVTDAIQKTFSCSQVSIIKELESYDDCNYCVQVDGTKYLAKVYNGVESASYIRTSATDYSGEKLSSIHLYLDIFQHLNQKQYGIVTSLPFCPSTIPSPVSIHELPVTSQEHSPAPLALLLLTWVEGSTMSSAKTLPIESLADAGRYLGNVCLALDDLTNQNPDACRTADRYHAWDGKNTLDLQDFVHCIQDERRRKLVQNVLDSFREQLVECDDKPDFRKGILQADFNDANIIMNSEGKVSGVIDFGDTTLSWRVLDISVAMAYAMMSSYGKDNRSISAAAAMLRGFHSVYPLTAIERKHLRLLIAARISCSATLGAYSYQQNPENKYLLLHAEPAWNALELMWGSSDGTTGSATAFNKVFDRACDCSGIDAQSIISCSDIALPDPSVVDDLHPIRETRDNEESTPKRPKTSDDKPSITFVTGNKKKLEEVKRILSPSSDSQPLPFQILNQKIDLPELQGDVLEIAREKCALAAKQVGSAVITEDTSLCFNALHDMPGPYIKWFLDQCGHTGLNNMIAFSEDKSGYAQTVVGFCPGPGKDVVVFDGRTKGTIVPARGPLDFGWDPIFQPDEGSGQTYAEMSKESKDAISHRSRAFSKMRDYLLQPTSSL